MKELEKRQIIGIALAIVLVMINILFIFVSIPILCVVLIDYILTKPKTKEIKEKEVPIEEDYEVDKIRARIEKIESENEYEKEVRKNVDLRQFKGRNNVTKKEVAEYLWYHKIWEGRREKEIICEEISKVCNITEEEIKWIINEHYNHRSNNGETGSGYWIKNEETRRELEYDKKKTLELEKEFKIIDEVNEYLIKLDPRFKEIIEKENKERTNDKYDYIYHYDEWLKKKGYV